MDSVSTETYPFSELEIENVLNITMYDKEIGKELMDFPTNGIIKSFRERINTCTFCPNNPSNGGSGICHCIWCVPHIT